MNLPVLLGLAMMPGLALVAVWLWSTRRARAQEGSHSNNGEEMSELQSVAEELKKITEKRSAKIVTSQNCGLNSSAGSSRSDFTNNARQCRELNREKSIDSVDTVGGMASIDEERPGTNDKSDKESPEFSRDSQIRQTDDEKNFNEPNGGISHDSCQDLAKTNGKNRECTSSSKASGHSIGDHGEREVLKEESAVPSDASARQKSGNIRRVDSQVSSSRTQSPDESSDVSSIDSKRGSPLGEKTSSTAGLEFEPTQPEYDTAEEITWELEFPQALCGRLIGKKGKNVQKISQITGTKIRLIPQKENSESSQRLVALTGSSKQLTLALKALQEKFPGVPFTRLNGKQPYAEASLTSPSPNIVRVALPENELCQVFVTNIVDANHFYVQLYDHLIHTHLRQLDQQMYQFYGGLTSAMMPQTINTGMLCAAVSPSGWWWRAQVVGLLMKPDEVEITWLDYGGRTTVPTGMLRQLR